MGGAIYFDDVVSRLIYHGALPWCSGCSTTLLQWYALRCYYQSFCQLQMISQYVLYTTDTDCT